MWLAMLWLGTGALAGDVCPWAEGAPLQVSAHVGRVTVNGQTYNVVGKIRKAEFTSLLGPCGFKKTSNSFNHWRDTRLIFNYTAINSIWILPALGLPVIGGIAAARRNTFVDAFEARE